MPIKLFLCIGVKFSDELYFKRTLLFNVVIYINAHFKFIFPFLKLLLAYYLMAFILIIYKIGTSHFTSDKANYINKIAIEYFVFCFLMLF